MAEDTSSAESGEANGPEALSAITWVVSEVTAL